MKEKIAEFKHHFQDFLAGNVLSIPELFRIGDEYWKMAINTTGESTPEEMLPILGFLINQCELTREEWSELPALMTLYTHRPDCQAGATASYCVILCSAIPEAIFIHNQCGNSLNSFLQYDDACKNSGKEFTDFIEAFGSEMLQLDNRIASGMQYKKIPESLSDKHKKLFRDMIATKDLIEERSKILENYKAYVKTTYSLNEVKRVEGELSYQKLASIENLLDILHKPAINSAHLLDNFNKALEVEKNILCMHQHHKEKQFLVRLLNIITFNIFKLEMNSIFARPKADTEVVELLSPKTAEAQDESMDVEMGDEDEDSTIEMQDVEYQTLLRG